MSRARSSAAWGCCRCSSRSTLAAADDGAHHDSGPLGRPAESLRDRVLDVVGPEEIVGRVDVDAVLERVDVDAVLERVDLDELLARVDVRHLMRRVGIPEIVAESTTSVSERVPRYAPAATAAGHPTRRSRSARRHRGGRLVVSPTGGRARRWLVVRRAMALVGLRVGSRSGTPISERRAFVRVLTCP